MRITKRQLRRIIKETLITESTIYVARGYMGTPMVEDENEDPVGMGDMIRALLSAGDDDIFNAPQGVSEESLQKLLKQDKVNAQGSIEEWDNDVFSNYYNVDLDRVIRLYARLNSLNVEEVETLPSWREDVEDIDDGTYEFEEYYS